ncbi:hypothetical protein HanRHA438_Chr14g0635931 [Helianthus annuus]|uniref:Uncharacterized protein n=1 Tax=Helianthus annuus TaxID=4232 RepID=A0A251SEA4_HELAN|nr:hypothetical protein HanXRQr2_Chr14g0625981 [Helianthus annuus]KAJ0838939.1 hypothetical protein HanPSC8_Chr14g0600721 [Helianthus annuus]KAJ0852246.1 hypothetical protein HanRHA438_Chr14g0635931 [Helianthus annuus]
MLVDTVKYVESWYTKLFADSRLGDLCHSWKQKTVLKVAEEKLGSWCSVLGSTLKGCKILIKIGETLARVCNIGN